MNQKIIIIIIFWFFLCPFAVGQDNNKKNPADSAKIYRDIEDLSKKNKYFKFLHSLIFRPVSPVPKEKKKVQKKDDRNFRRAQDKIVRNIEITTLDPFGLNINDTSVIPKYFLPKVGNKLHIKSRRLTILNLILFKKNEVFDSLKVKESERLIRAQDYIRDVVVKIEFNKARDSVDIIFTAQDLWSIEFNGNVSASGGGINITDKNFLGLGHQFQHAISKYTYNKEFAFETNYYIRNIRNSFINSNIHYKVNPDNSFLKRFLVERPFYSSFARWAGGIILDQQYHTDSILFLQDNYKFIDVKYNLQDYWIGKSWQLSSRKSAYFRSTNFILSSRFLRVNYLQRPDTSVLPIHTFAHEKFFLLSAGINTRLYLQDKYIFRYGLTEDIPTGKIFNITSGYQVQNKQVRLYAGVKVAWADYFRWGYLSNYIEYGTFFKNGKTEQGALKQGITYFTELIPWGRWNFRQFIKPAVVIGIQRLDNDRLYIRSDSITSSVQFLQREKEWSGIHRFMLTLQTQSYAPWNLYGFRFGPFFSISMVILSDKNFSFGNSKLYSQFDIGILVKNEFLLFNYFQISLSFNPVIPGGKNNIFRGNAYQTSDLGLPEFDTGKPSIILYQ